MNKKKKYYLIGDTSEKLNWGCYATTKALKDILNDKFELIGNLKLNKIDVKKNSKLFKFVMELLYKKKLNNKAYKLLIFYFSKVYFRYRPDFVPKYFIDFKKIISGNLQAFNEEILQIKKSDYVVINGEGSIYNFQRKGRYKLFLAYVAKVVFKKKVFILNHSLDVSNKLVREMVVKTYPLMDFISFREMESLNIYRSINRSGVDNFKYIPDSVLTLDTNIKDCEFKFFLKKNNLLMLLENKFIAIGGSSLLNRNDNAHTLPTKFYSNLIRHFLNLNYKILLTVSDSSDELLFESFQSNSNIFFLRENYSDTINIINVIKHAKLFVTGRWHPSLFAYLNNIPCLSLDANSHKMKAFQKLSSNNYLYNFNLGNNFNKLIKDSNYLLKKVNFKYSNKENDISLAHQLKYFVN